MVKKVKTSKQKGKNKQTNKQIKALEQQGSIAMFQF